MSSYTITITPDDPARAITTLRVEITGTTTRITELLVRAGDGDGLIAGQLPTVDINQLLRAVTPGLPPPVLDTPTGEQPATPLETVTQAETTAWSQAAAGESPGTTPANGSGTRPHPPRGGTATATKTGRRAGRSARASATSATGTRTSVSRAAKTARVSTGKATSKVAGADRRSYRRAPADLAEVLAQIRTPSAVADHYGVPRHTAQSWLRTMRRRAARPS